MIYKVNEEELYLTSLRVLNEGGILPERCEGFVERKGIKMVSDEDNNFLQGFASFDINNLNEVKNIFTWVNPICKDSNYNNILYENMILLYDLKELINNKFDNKISEDNEMSNKRQTKKNMKKNSENNKNKNIKGIYVSSTNHDLNKSCIHCEDLIKSKNEDLNNISNNDNRNNNNNNKNNKNNIKGITTVCTSEDSSVGSGSCYHFEDKSETFKNNINDQRIANMGDFKFLTESDIDIYDVANSFNEREAELPSLMKSNIHIISEVKYDSDNNIIGFISADVYNTPNESGIKGLNIYVKPEFRNNGIANELFSKFIKNTEDFIKNSNDINRKGIFIMKSVGSNKDFVEKILNKNNFVNEGSTRGGTLFTKEFNF